MAPAKKSKVELGSVPTCPKPNGTPATVVAFDLGAIVSKPMIIPDTFPAPDDTFPPPTLQAALSVER